MLKAIILPLLFVAFAYLAYALWFLVHQRRTVFPRHRIPYDDVLVGPPEDAEVFWTPLESGGKSECWYLEPLVATNMDRLPLAIAAHGNGEVIDRWAWKVQGLREMGFAVLLVEYPGYGRSGGKPSEASVTKAMVQAYDTITQKESIDLDHVLLVGRSLGTGAVCRLSRFRASRAIILVSPFTSIWDHAKKRFLPPMFVKDPFDNLGAIKEYSGEVMIVHGKQDRLNPFSHAQKLRSAHPESQLIAHPEAAHHDCPPDWVALWQDVKPFLEDAGFRLAD